jgi:hypothetical protein
MRLPQKDKSLPTPAKIEKTPRFKETTTTEAPSTTATMSNGAICGCDTFSDGSTVKDALLCVKDEVNQDNQGQSIKTKACIRPNNGDGSCPNGHEKCVVPTPTMLTPTTSTLISTPDVGDSKTVTSVKSVKSAKGENRNNPVPAAQVVGTTTLPTDTFTTTVQNSDAEDKSAQPITAPPLLPLEWTLKFGVTAEELEQIQTDAAAADIFIEVRCAFFG